MKRNSRNKGHYSLFELHNSLKTGFTLIELLVVVSIIGLLATLSLTSFTTVQKQARDTSRKNDLKQYQAALTSYAGRNGGFYLATGGTTSQIFNSCTALGMANCQEDPKVTASVFYRYQSNGTAGGSNATTYVLWANNETPVGYWIVCSNGKSGAVAGATAPTITNGVCPL